MAARVKPGDDEPCYYFAATILRATKRVIRQGTVKGKNDQDAMDNAYALAKKWGKPIVEMKLYEVLDTGEIEWVMTSTIGDIGGTAKREDKDESDGDSDNHDEYDELAFAYGMPYGSYSPINGAPDSTTKNFAAWEIGTYFRPENFATFRPVDTEAK